MAKCVALTEKKKPCSVNADRVRGGKDFCHVHDPEGVFRAQQEAKRTNEGQSTIARRKESR